MRNISFALTEPQFLDGSKTVTRRMGWRKLQAGQHLMGVRKAMGLKPGEKIVRLGIIIVTWVNPEPLRRIDRDEVVREGFPNMTPEEFIAFFCRSHKGCTPETEITRISFRHVKDWPDLPPTLWGEGMKRADATAALPCAPAALRLASAAAYVGVSVSHFLKAQKEGVMPGPVDLMGAKVYRRVDLDEALAMLARAGGDVVPDAPGVDDWADGDVP